MPELRAVIEAIRSGRNVSDTEFDRVYPPAVSELSAHNFTPVAVARRAAELLVSSPGTRILDVGSGAGKFCLIGALATAGSFTGVERNALLLQAAQRVVVRYRVRRAHFIHGDMELVDWTGYEGFYLFNPFVSWGGNGFGLSSMRRILCIEIVRSRLAEAPPGTRVVTYHGFGGEMPAGYRRVHVEGKGASGLELWIKQLSAVGLTYPSAWSMSLHRSATDSIPTDSRRSPSPMPSARRASGARLACEDVAG